MPSRLAGIALLVFCAGCSGATELDEVERVYVAGDVAAAGRMLNEAEDKVGDFRPVDQIRYGYLRGIVESESGGLQCDWLMFAKRKQRSYPAIKRSQWADAGEAAVARIEAAGTKCRFDASSAIEERLADAHFSALLRIFATGAGAIVLLPLLIMNLQKRGRVARVSSLKARLILSLTQATMGLLGFALAALPAFWLVALAASGPSPTQFEKVYFRGGSEVGRAGASTIDVLMRDHMVATLGLGVIVLIGLVFSISGVGYAVAAWLPLPVRGVDKVEQARRRGASTMSLIRLSMGLR